VDGTSNLTLSMSVPDSFEIISASVSAVGGSVDSAFNSAVFVGAAPSSASSSTLIWAFGPLKIIGDGLFDENADYIELTLAVLPKASSVLQNGDIITVNASISTEGELSSFSQTLSVSEPKLNATIELSATSGDAADIVNVHLLLKHLLSSSGPAYNTVVNMTLLGLAPSLPSLSLTQAGVPVPFSILEDRLEFVSILIVGPYSPFSEMDLVLPTTVLNSVRPGQALAPTAIVTFQSAPNSTVSRAAATTAFAVPGSSIFVVPGDAGLSSGFDYLGTSFNQPSSRISVGELISYRAVLHLVEGTSRVYAEIRLPAGSAITLESGYVSNVGASINATTSALLSSQNATLVDLDLDGILDTVVFDFGSSVQNSGNNVQNDDDTIEIAVQLRVADVPAVFDAATFTLRTSVIIEGAQFNSTNTIAVVEPLLALTSSFPATSGMSGDLVPIQITAAHQVASSADARNLTFSLVVSLGLTPVSGSLSVTLDGAPIAVSASFSAQLVVVNVPILPLGSVVVFSFDLTANDAVRPSKFETADGSVVYFSGPSTSSGRQRTVSVSNSFRTFNSTSSSAFRLISSDILETLNSDACVGEEIDFELKVVLVDGTSNLTVLLQLPTVGSNQPLQLVSGVVASVGSSVLTTGLVGSVPTLNVDTNGDGISDRFIWILGDIVVSGDGYTEGSAESLVLSVAVLVRNTAIVTPGLQSLLSTSIIVANAQNSTFSQNLRVVQPQVSSTGALSLRSGDAGDVVPVSMVISHDVASSSTAFGLNITIRMPGFILNTSSISLSVNGEISTDWTGALLSYESMSILVSKFDRGNGSISLAFAAVVSDFARASTNLVPSATVSFLSHSRGEVSRNLTSVTVWGPPFSMNSVAPIAASLVTSTEFSRPNSRVSIGEQIYFRITCYLVEGTSSLNVSLQAPISGPSPVLSIRSAVVESVGANIVTSLTTASSSIDRNGDGVIDFVVFDFGPSVRNLGDNVVSSADSITILIVGSVVDRVSIASSLTFSVASAVMNNGVVSSLSTSLSVVEPRLLSTFEFIGSTSVMSGVFAPFRLSVSHAAASTSDAYSVKFAINLPAELISGDSTVASVSATFSGQAAQSLSTTVTNTTLEVTFAQLSLGSTASITFGFVVSDAVFPSQIIRVRTNTSFLSATDGVISRQRSLEATASVPVIANVPQSLILLSQDSELPETLFANISVGEHVSFSYRVTLVDGTSDVNVTIRLPTFGSFRAFAFESATTSFVGSAVSGIPLGFAPTEQTDLFVQWRFRNVTVRGDAITSSATDSIELSFVVFVLDTGAVSTGIRSSISSVLETQGERTTSDFGVRFVEPRLAASATLAVTSGDAADPVPGYAIVSHQGSSTAAAFSTVVALILPGMVPSNQVTVTVAGTPLPASSWRVLTTFEEELSIMLDVHTVELGPIRIDFLSVVSDRARVGSSLAPIVLLRYKSHPNPVGSRSYTASQSLPLFQVLDRPSSPIIVINRSSSLNLPSNTVTVGELIFYRVRVHLAEGLSSLNVTVSLPSTANSLIFVNASVSFCGAQIDPTSSGILNTFQSAGSAFPSSQRDSNSDGQLDTFLFDFGSGVMNRGDNVEDSNDEIEVLIVARIADAAPNVNGATLSMSANAVAQGINANAVDSVTIVEPLLRSSTSITDASARSGSAGTTIPFGVLLRHERPFSVSRSSAYQVSVLLQTAADIAVDAGTVLIELVPSLPVSGSTVEQISSGTVRVNLTSIEVPDSISISASGVVLNSARPGQFLSVRS
jgi:hypothetical protein